MSCVFAAMCMSSSFGLAGAGNVLPLAAALAVVLEEVVEAAAAGMVGVAVTPLPH